MADLPLYLLLVSLLVAIPLFYFRRSSARGHGSALRLPPSPWALPVIGHIHHLALAGALPHRAMRDLAAPRPAHAAPARRAPGPRRVLGRRGARDHAGKGPRLRDAAHQPDGQAPARRGQLRHRLRALRRRVAAAPPDLHHGALLRAPRPVVQGSARGGGPPPPPLRRRVGFGVSLAVNLSEMVSAYVADASVRAIIGSRFRDRETFLTLLERRLKIMPASSLPDLFPSSRLAMFISPTPRLMMREREKMMAFIDTIIQDHRDNSAAGVDEEDLLDVLLRIQRGDELDPPLTTDNMKNVIVDIFAASSETSATTLSWIMAELMRNPRVMRKAQDEVRRVLDGEESVTEDSLGELRYLPLVIKEALRLHPPATLLIPRECRSPCQVLGFNVPAGAMVLVNAWAIGRDPSNWDAPEEFMPERFENSDVDFKGSDFEFIPFGAGRRMCPGIGFGLANMDLALASLLYHFDWKLPDGMEPGQLDMTEALGITTRRLSHLMLVPTVRVPLRGNRD
ncbi:hypothetical protein SEVIR_2G440700v4 [Setaria viridis]|uniref:Cytochrome P450 n=1 Tax=Setaria viridis TaxID=4556 RepID=A0A4U6W408_SETVI|nr:hypothetical protein SEVIR_2G440700v2 [Setaria viridis]